MAFFFSFWCHLLNYLFLALCLSQTQLLFRGYPRPEEETIETELLGFEEVVFVDSENSLCMVGVAPPLTAAFPQIDNIAINNLRVAVPGVSDAGSHIF